MEDQNQIEELSGSYLESETFYSGPFAYGEKSIVDTGDAIFDHHFEVESEDSVSLSLTQSPSPPSIALDQNISSSFRWGAPHSSKSIHSCEICGLEFRMRARLKEHMNTHTSERPYKCTKCDATFCYSSWLDRHRAQKHVDKEEKPELKCPICPKIFTNRTYMKEHLLYHNAKKDKKCDTCGKCFKRISHLYRHKRQVHNMKIIPKPQKKECPVCKKILSDHCMSSHLKRHNGRKGISS